MIDQIMKDKYANKDGLVQAYTVSTISNNLRVFQGSYPMRIDATQFFLK